MNTQEQDRSKRKPKKLKIVDMSKDDKELKKCIAIFQKAREKQFRDEKKAQEEERKEHIVGTCVVCKGKIREIKTYEHESLCDVPIGGTIKGWINLEGYYCLSCGLRYHRIPK